MKSLKSKLVLIFTVVILVLTMGIGFVSIQLVSKNLVKDYRNQLEEIAIAESRYIKARRDAQLQYLDGLARNPMLVDDTSSLEDKIAFFEAEAKRTGFLAFAFVDKEGNSTVMNSKYETTNVAHRDYFQSALKGKLATSDLIISSVTGELVLIYASPIYKNNEIVGVLYGRKDGNAIATITQNVTYGETGYAYVVNNDGRIVGHPDIELVLKQYNLKKAVEDNPDYAKLSELMHNEILLRNSGSGGYEFEGDNRMVGFAPVEDSPWIVVVSSDEQEVLSQVEGLRNIIIILCFIALVIGAGITYFISSKISSPIKKITQVAQEIADGHFDVELSINSQDELGQLAQAFNLTIERLVNYQGYIDEISHSLQLLSEGDLKFKLEKNYIGQFQKIKLNMEAFLQKMNDTLAQINESSDQVSAGADQVASGAQALSQGATEQASAIEQLSASINEITNQIKQNAENARLANDSAELAGKQIFNSNEQMKNMVQAMDDIASKSSEISKIIKVIEDIAFQTNILALNAAVEAARAGAAGKGFAVVADEVGNLASKSAKAAKSTTSLIEETIVAVQKGSDLASNTAVILDESAKVTKKAVTLIDKIAIASDQQAKSASEVSIGVDQISSVVQTNSATSEESAAASEELSGQARVLKDLMDQFQLRTGVHFYKSNTKNPKKENQTEIEDYGFSKDKY